MELIMEGGNVITAIGTNEEKLLLGIESIRLPVDATY